MGSSLLISTSPQLSQRHFIVPVVDFFFLVIICSLRKAPAWGVAKFVLIEPQTSRRELLERFFADHPDAALHKRVLKALRFLAAGDKPLAGKPAGWAGGIIYAVANRDRQACGVPGLLNSEFEARFGVSMGTICKRAAQIEELLAW